jgi:hypothetical protein
MEYLFLGGVLVENLDRALENLLFGLVSARILGKGLKENKKEGQRITISERNFKAKLGYSSQAISSYGQALHLVTPTK